jgi:hypothetical protein
VTAIAKDLSQPNTAEDLWSKLSASNIRIEILVNNAGVGAYGEFQNQSLREIERMQMLNVVALTSLTRLALPEMLARKHGRILNFPPWSPTSPVVREWLSTILRNKSIRFVLFQRSSQRTRWFRCIGHSTQPWLNKVVI